ncbi:MetS family NSS transporter small subunit [Vibrio sp. PP-XX7]
MDTSAIFMMVLGLGMTWGGAIFCIRKAMNKNK